MPRRKKTDKNIRINRDAYISRIKEKYGSITNASKEMGRTHHYLSDQFRKFNIEFPESLLLEIQQELGIDYRDVKKGKIQNAYADNQICFETFGEVSKVEEETNVENVISDENEETELNRFCKLMIEFAVVTRDRIDISHDRINLMSDCIEILSKKVEELDMNIKHEKAKRELDVTLLSKEIKLLKSTGGTKNEQTE